MKKISINGKEITIESGDFAIKDFQKPLYELDQYTWSGWCNLIAWFMNCDELHFMNAPKMRTAQDIFESNSMGELMFVHSASQFTSDIISQIIPKFPVEWKEKIEKCLAGEEVEPEAKFATGFGLKCKTILWKTSEEFESQVEEILKKNWS